MEPETELEWHHYIPLSLIGFLFGVLLLAIANQERLLRPLTTPTFSRLSLLFFSWFGGICFIGMLRFGYYIWKGTLYLVNRISRKYTGERTQ